MRKTAKLVMEYMRDFTTPAGMFFDRLLFVLYGRTVSDETGQNNNEFMTTEIRRETG